MSLTKEQIGSIRITLKEILGTTLDAGKACGLPVPDDATKANAGQGIDMICDMALQSLAQTKTLRDEFAAAVVQGLFAADTAETRVNFKLRACLAFEMADDMLKAREWGNDRP